MTEIEFPQWLDKTEESDVGVITLDDGKKMTAEIAKFDDESGEVVLNIIDGQRGLVIPADRIVSFDPQERATQPWPYSDPCRNGSSPSRLILMAMLFLSWIVGSIPLFLTLINRPYGLQEASVISYTIFVVFFTFAATKTWRPYMFTCPAVQPQLGRMLWRHLGFLVVLIVIQTAALAAHPYLPEWWNTEGKKGTPFEVVLLFLCIGVGFVQIYTNRSLLDRAHREFSE
ncbi:MAG: hypothetical protein FWD64_01850 [Acidobacteriaceae bacterium]|nr:hypothetical protein [Acidobacteriaceae bacterium]